MNRLLLRFCIAISAALAALGAGEVAVRALGVAPGYAAIPFGQYATSADPELLWEPRAGAEGVNGDGLRGPELDAAATRPRWLVLGDSIAWGIDLDQPETIPARLQAHMWAAGREVEVLNGGVSAYNTLQEARRFELLAPRLEPEHVVLLVCVNDVDTTDSLPEGVVRSAHRDAAADALLLAHDVGRGSQIRRELLERSHLARLLHGTLARPSRARAGPDLPADAAPIDVVREGLTRIADIARRHGVGVTVVMVPEFKDLGPEYGYRRLHDQVLAQARELGCDALDLLPLAIEHGAHDPQSLSLPGDLLHPNARGADLIAQAISEHCLRQGAGSRQE